MMPINSGGWVRWQNLDLLMFCRLLPRGGPDRRG